MNCQEANNIFYKYIDRELSLPEERSLLLHLDACSDCADAFETALAMDRLLSKAMSAVDPPADLTDRIMAAYDRSLPSQHWWQGILESWNHWRRSLQLRVAAVSIAVFALIFFGNSMIKTPAPMIGDTSGTQAGTVQSVEPDVQEPGEKNTNNAAASVSGDKSGQGTQTASEKDNKPDSKETTVKPASGKTETVQPAESGEKGIVKLPQAASIQNRVGSVEIVPMVEGLRGSAAAPVLSADGKTIFYTAVVDDEKQAWSLELKSGAVPQNIDFAAVPAGEEKNVQPDWWPGTLPAASASTVTFDWSPDKKQLAVNIGTSADDPQQKAGIWRVQADGSAPAEIAQVGGGDALAWSADGSKIAFSDAAGGIYVFYVRENVLIQVTDEKENFRSLRDLLWKPDNKTIIFYGRRDDAPGGGIYQITLP